MIDESSALETALPRDAVVAPRPFAGFRALSRQAFREGWRRRRVALLAIGAVAVGIVLGRMARIDFGPPSSGGATDDGDRSAIQLWTALSQFVVSMVYPLLALLIGSQGFARLRSDRTLVYHLARPVGRGTIFLARWVGCLPLLIAIAVAGMSATLLASGVAVPSEAWVGLFALTIVAMLVLSAVYFTLAAMARHGIVIGLVYTFVIEGFLAAVPGTLQRASIGHHVRALLVSWCGPGFSTLGPSTARAVRASTSDRDAENLPALFSQTEYLDGPTALIVLLSIGLSFLLLGMVSVRQRDWPLKD